MPIVKKMGESRVYFGIADYVVFGTMLAISAAIGIYYRFTGGKQKTLREYMLADGNMSIIPVGFSLMASFMSAITLLGVSTENYIYGTQFVVINAAYLIATPIAVYGYLPVFFKLQATSAYEYLEQRFGMATRLAASVAFCLQMILYMGIVLYAPSIALAAVTGLSRITSILSVGLVCTFYSTIGGMKAVLITDVFQSLLMFAAIYCVIVKGVIDAGGFANIWKIARDGERLEFFNLDFDPTVRQTFWTQMVGGIFTYLTVYAVNQAQVQRLLTVRDLKKSQRALWLNFPILLLLSVSTSFAGLTIFSRYYKCDPLKQGRIPSPDQLLPLFVVDSMGHIPGLPGLFVAGIFSGSLSTVSSAVNSLSAVTFEDFIKPFLIKVCRVQLSPRSSPVITKMLALFYGLSSLGLAFLAEYLGGILQAALTIFGVVGGPLLGLFTLGMFFTLSTQMGSLTGFIVGLAFSLWIGFGGPKPPLRKLPVSIDGCESLNYSSSMNVSLIQYGLEVNHTAETNLSPVNSTYYFPLYKISYMWYAVIGFSVTLIVGLFFSCLTRCFKKGAPVDSKLLSPWVLYNFKSKCNKKKKMLVACDLRTKEKNGGQDSLKHEDGESFSMMTSF